MRTIYDSQEDESLQLFPEPEPHFRFQRVPEKKNERTAEDEVVAKSYFFCVSGATSAPPRDHPSSSTSLSSLFHKKGAEKKGTHEKWQKKRRYK